MCVVHPSPYWCSIQLVQINHVSSVWILWCGDCEEQRIRSTIAGKSAYTMEYERITNEIASRISKTKWIKLAQWCSIRVTNVQQKKNNHKITLVPFAESDMYRNRRKICKTSVLETKALTKGPHESVPSRPKRRETEQIVFRIKLQENIWDCLLSALRGLEMCSPMTTIISYRLRLNWRIFYGLTFVRSIFLLNYTTLTQSLCK